MFLIVVYRSLELNFVELQNVFSRIIEIEKLLPYGETFSSFGGGQSVATMRLN